MNGFFAVSLLTQDMASATLLAHAENKASTPAESLGLKTAVSLHAAKPMAKVKSVGKCCVWPPRLLAPHVHARDSRHHCSNARHRLDRHASRQLKLQDADPSLTLSIWPPSKTVSLEHDEQDLEVRMAHGTTGSRP